MDEAGRIEGLVAPCLAGLGYDLVRVRVGGGGGRRTLQIMAERRDRAEMGLDDCAGISRVVSALLDVEDPVDGAYTLEISSPGLDRSLVGLGDYARFEGRDARVETKEPIAGRKRFKGRLLGVRGTDVRILCGGAEAEIPFDAVLRGKLLLTDEAVSAAMRGGGG